MSLLKLKLLSQFCVFVFLLLTAVPVFAEISVEKVYQNMVASCSGLKYQRGNIAVVLDTTPDLLAGTDINHVAMARSSEYSETGGWAVCRDMVSCGNNIFYTNISKTEVMEMLSPYWGTSPMLAFYIWTTAVVDNELLNCRFLNRNQVGQSWQFDINCCEVYLGFPVVCSTGVKVLDSGFTGKIFIGGSNVKKQTGGLYHGIGGGKITP